MILARVLGNVVTPVQHEFFDGQKLLLVRPEKPTGAPAGGTLVAIDRVHAGPGDRVLVIHEGSSTRDLIGRSDAPVRTVVVGVVDQVELERDARER